MSNKQANEDGTATGASTDAGDVQGEAVAVAPKRTDPIRRITLIVLAICFVVFVWYVIADRLTPFTGQARVQALVVPIAPRVSGYVDEVNVQLHSQVEGGDLMFRLDQRPFELAILSAEANLDNIGQQVGAQTAQVKSAAGRLGVARAQLDRAQRNYKRVEDILKDNPGALSQADRDRAETSLAQALERVSSAEADLETAKQQLGVVGPENPQLRSAVAAVEQARLDLAFTELLAPSRGVIESFNIDVGHNAQANQPLATFVSTNDVWIVADMKENNLGHITPGNRVEFVLDAMPGRVYRGVVRSVGVGVDAGGPTSRGELPTVSSAQGWLRDPQRFPVIIGFDAQQIAGHVRSGGQVDVVVYTGNNFLLNAIAWVRIRVTGLVSYVR